MDAVVVVILVEQAMDAEVVAMVVVYHIATVVIMMGLQAHGHCGSGDNDGVV